jgi:hypothetical protein
MATGKTEQTSRAQQSEAMTRNYDRLEAPVHNFRDKKHWNDTFHMSAENDTFRTSAENDTFRTSAVTATLKPNSLDNRKTKTTRPPSTVPDAVPPPYN